MANRSTLANVPHNIEYPIVLRRFLTKLVEQLDEAIGNLSSEATSDVTADDDTETAVGQARENTKSLDVLYGYLEQTTIADTTGTATTGTNETKINEILAALRLAKVIK